MTITNLQEAEAALLPYVPLVSQAAGKATTLKRIKPLMELLGHPEDSFKAVHIAGTSGKTSTAYFMAALLKAAGKKAGLTVSPHVDRLNERVQIDGRPLDETKFCAELGEFLEIIKDIADPPTYFELLYAFAIWVFARQGVDYAVVETGMGGLYDATNVITRPDKVCVITDIGYDHMHILGNTLPEIAAQKVGIVHEGNTVCMYEQSAEIMEVIKEWCDGHHASLHTTDEAAERAQASIDLGGLPAYQQRNWLLAYYVYRLVQQRDRLPALHGGQLAQTLVQVPARMEIVQRGDKTIVMDGAHNLQKMTAFVDSFRQRFPDKRPLIIVAFKEGKQYSETLPLLTALSDQFIVTTFATSQDLPARSVDPGELARRLTEARAMSMDVVPEHGEALAAALQQPAEVIVITGSFYLLSQLRAQL